MPIQHLQPLETLPEEGSQGNESFSNNNKRFPAYPLTPYPTVLEVEDCSPSTIVTWHDLAQTTGSDADSISMIRSNEPSISCDSPLGLSLNVSSEELQKVWDSLLDQVDWLAVAKKVAKHRAPSVYFNAVEKILLSQIHRLVRNEDEDNEVDRLENGRGDIKGMDVYDYEKKRDSELQRGTQEEERAFAETNGDNEAMQSYEYCTGDGTNMDYYDKEEDSEK